MSLPIFAFIISQERRIYFKNIYQLFWGHERCSGNGKTSPTDDGTAMVVFIYGILKTLLVMFFDCLCLKPGDKYQRKKQYFRDGP